MWLTSETVERATLMRMLDFSKVFTIASCPGELSLAHHLSISRRKRNCSSAVTSSNRLQRLLLLTKQLCGGYGLYRSLACCMVVKAATLDGDAGHILALHYAHYGNDSPDSAAPNLRL